MNIYGILYLMPTGNCRKHCQCRYSCRCNLHINELDEFIVENESTAGDF